MATFPVVRFGTSAEREGLVKPIQNEGLFSQCRVDIKILKPFNQCDRYQEIFECVFGSICVEISYRLI